MPNLAEHLWTGGRTMAIFLLHFLNTIINYKVYQGPQSCNHILYDFYIYKILLNYAHISLQRMKSADNDRCFEDIALCRYCTLQILKYSQTWNLQLCILRYRSADFWFQALQYASMYNFVLVFLLDPRGRKWITDLFYPAWDKWVIFWCSINWYI